MNIESWLIHTIYVASATTTLDGYGKPTYGTPTAVKCRHEGRSKLVPGTLNEQQWNDRLTTTTEIKPDDKVWLPGDDSSDASLSKRPILITSATDKAGGFTLWEVFL